MPTVTDEFLDLYKQLEYVGRNTFFPHASDNENIIGRLINLPQMVKYKEEINYCRVVRNFLTHNPRVGGAYPLEPSAQMLALLRRILAALEMPPLAMDFAIRRKHMLTVQPSDFVVDAMHRLREKAYTHAPVMEKGKLLGVFSDGVVSDYICAHRGISLSEETTLAQFQDFYRLHAPENQVYAFIASDTPLAVAEAIFQDNYKRRQLISVVYITQKGSTNESILGMLTPWDVLAVE